MSGIIARRDQWNDKAKMVNNMARNYCLNKDSGYIDHDNINVRGHLNKGGGGYILVGRGLMYFLKTY